MSVNKLWKVPSEKQGFGRPQSIHAVRR